MTPGLSRRQFLAGGTVLAGGVAGCVSVAPAKYLPEAIATRRTALRPVPQLSPSPPVSTEHAEAARSALADAIKRAEKAVARRPEEVDLPGVAEPETSLNSARSHAESARGTSTWATLSTVRRGMKYAGEAIGSVRVMTDDASGEYLASRARDLQSRIERIHRDIEYAVAEPSAGLARLYWVEKLLALGYLNSYRDGTYMGQQSPTTSYQPRDVVRTWGSHFEARRYAADAAALLRDYRAGVSDTERLLSHVEPAEAAIRAEANDCTPTTDEFDRRDAAIEQLEPGPFRTFLWQVFFPRQTADVRSPDGPWKGVALYRAVSNAEVVLTCAGSEYARQHAEFDAGDDVTPAMLDRAKQVGLRLLERRVRAARERPMLALLLREPRRLLWAGDLELETERDVDHPKARAYGKYLRAVGYLRAVTSMAARIDRPST